MGRFVEERPFAVPGLPDQQITIWLPPGYDNSDRRYPVLYMHDGHNLFDPAKANFQKVWAADKAIIQLVEQGKIEPHIIVGIWAPGKDRYRQYLPDFAAKAATGAVAQSIDQHSYGKPNLSRRYLSWLADELRPRIDRQYRTLTGPSNTAIAGSSMGGLMSCYAIVERPDIYGKAACVSSHWPIALVDIALQDQAQDQAQDKARVKQIWQDWLGQNLGDAKGRRIWMDHGTATLDAHYPPYQQAVDEAFAKAGWRKGEQWQSRQYDGAEHEENAWAARLPEVLGWLLAKP